MGFCYVGWCCLEADHFGAHLRYYTDASVEAPGASQSDQEPQVGTETTPDQKDLVTEALRAKFGGSPGAQWAFRVALNLLDTQRASLDPRDGFAILQLQEAQKNIRGIMEAYQSPDVEPPVSKKEAQETYERSLDAGVNAAVKVLNNFIRNNYHGKELSYRFPPSTLTTVRGQVVGRFRAAGWVVEVSADMILIK